MKEDENVIQLKSGTKKCKVQKTYVKKIKFGILLQVLAKMENIQQVLLTIQ